jgi:4-hydroxybenzoate polyprenyltransferase
MACSGEHVTAARRPTAANIRCSVAAGIHALLPLQAALTAQAGFPGRAAAIAAALPLARWSGRKVSPT